MKKIKFPLLLRGEYPARNIEELRQYFDIEKLYEYLCDGRLLTWLEDRQYGEAEEIKGCTELEENLAEKLCRIFQVEYETEYSEKMKALQKTRTGFIFGGRKDTNFEPQSGGILGSLTKSLFGTRNAEEEPEQENDTEKNGSKQYMFCTGCGMGIKRNVRFCNYCGKKNTYGEVQ